MIDKKELLLSFSDLKKKYQGKVEDDVLIQDALNINKLFSQKKLDLEKLNYLRNKLNQEIKKNFQQNKKHNFKSEEKKKRISQEIKTTHKDYLFLKSSLDKILSVLPNIPFEYQQKKDKIVKFYKAPKRKLTNLDHTQIATRLGWVDFHEGVNLSGSRFVCYKNDGALFYRALISFLLAFHRKNNFTEYRLPVLVKPEILWNSGNLPKFKNDLYEVTKNNLFLIPTAESPLVNIYKNKVLPLEFLPKSLVASTLCFRQEAGSAGKKNHGLIRIHQFEKVEMVVYSQPEKSMQVHEKMVGYVEEILKQLEISFQVVLLGTKNLGFSSAKTYDINCWLPSKRDYLEISSCSNCTDFQARRGNIKFLDKNNKKQYVHILNGSGLPIDRLIAVCLENYYNEETKKLDIPKALEKFF